MSKSAKRPPLYEPPESIKKDPIALKVWHQLDYKVPDELSPGEVRRKSIGNILLTLFLFLASIFYWYVASAAGLAFLVGERERGNQKQCIYDYLGDEYIITIPSYRVCPPTIEVDE